MFNIIIHFTINGLHHFVYSKTLLNIFFITDTDCIKTADKILIIAYWFIKHCLILNIITANQKNS